MRPPTPNLWKNSQSQRPFAFGDFPLGELLRSFHPQSPICYVILLAESRDSILRDVASPVRFQAAAWDWLLAALAAAWSWEKHKESTDVVDELGRPLCQLCFASSIYFRLRGVGGYCSQDLGFRASNGMAQFCLR